MARFQLASDETLVDNGLMSLKQKWGLSSQLYQGTIYVTNRRICFHMSMSGTVLMDIPLPEVKGFSVGRILFVTAVTIHSRAGEQFLLTGFPAKKLQNWLLQLGIPRLK